MAEPPPNPLRAAGATALFVGAAGSAGLTAYAGRRNPSIFLIVLFMGWAVGPFFLLWLASRAEKLRKTAFALALAIAPVSLTLDAYVAFGFGAVKLGRWFLLVPAALMMSEAVAMAAAAMMPTKADSRP